MAFGGLDLIDDDLEFIDTDAQIMDIQIEDSIVIDWDYLDEIFSTCGPMESSSASLSPCAATQKRMKLPPTLSPSAKKPPAQYLTSLPHRPAEGKQKEEIVQEGGEAMYSSQLYEQSTDAWRLHGPRG
ncbi:Aste57867_24287 [Aphanomyces stellatus]|uniref:Aste57867_24287 protein n=1 Tax=Aphanomyces stellatus TaxID=120398 RepID=A0A485LQ22_9STRA|nr:hypothetical protein As57867_024212 [Aphanomyces stellatus]VFU00927.1 Aste57867_24287 [Aphanomyces stellatus]